MFASPEKHRVCYLLSAFADQLQKTMKKKNKKNGSGLKKNKKHGENGQGIARDKEVERLRRELKRVTWELDFLKEAAAFLAKTSGSATNSIEHAQRARATGAPWAAVSSASRTARIPAAGLHFPQRNRLLHHSAPVTAGRRLHAVQLHWLEHGL